MPFYEYSQNNSGGHFHVDDKVCHCVIIEARSADEADIIAQDLGIYFDGVSKDLDCSCCGDRWTEAYKPIDLVATNESYLRTDGIRFADLDDYLQFISDKYGWTEPDCRVYYQDGSVKEYYTTSK